MSRVVLIAAAAVLLGGCGGTGSSGVSSEPVTAMGFEFTRASDVSEGAPIPGRYTCDGENSPPDLVWTDVPEGTQQLAIVLEDPDAPGGTFTHWLAWGIDPTATKLSSESPMPSLGGNDFGSGGYQGPCPPRGQTHHYIFRLLALDKPVDLDEGADRAAFDDAVTQHVLAEARLTATYERP